MNSNGNDPYLTAKIATKYLIHNKLSVNQLGDLITTVHQAIGHLGQPTELEELLTPAVSVRRSVQHGYVVCLDCGFKALTLRRHVNVQHGLNPDEYLRRWGLKSDYPLTAPAYSERRSAMAKALGLGRKPSIQVGPAETQVVASAPVEADQKSAAAPKPRRRTRRATKLTDVVPGE